MDRSLHQGEVNELGSLWKSSQQMKCCTLKVVGCGDKECSIFCEPAQTSQNVCGREACVI